MLYLCNHHTVMHEYRKVSIYIILVMSTTVSMQAV